MSELKELFKKTVASETTPINESKFVGFNLGTVGVGRKFEKIRSGNKYIWINHANGEIDHTQDIIKKYNY